MLHNVYVNFIISFSFKLQRDEIISHQVQKQSVRIFQNNTTVYIFSKQVQSDMH